MTYETIIYEIRERYAVITLNRPEKLNAFNEVMFNEWLDALDRAAVDDEVRAVIWTGAGERAFSTGFDISPEAGREGGSPVDRTPEEARQSMERSCRFAMRLWDHPKPIVAAVAGYCLAVAHEFVQMCDIVIAAENAVFGEPEIRHHSCPPILITPYIVGLHKAKELLLMGESIGAREAEQLGLVNRVVAPEKLMAEAERIAKRLALVPALSVTLNKRSINQLWEQMGLRQTLSYNANIGAIVHTTDVPEWQRFREIQREHGFKAFLDARDRPFRELEPSNEE
jgi:enoyl-CoA hydratase/carnithine racemase